VPIENALQYIGINVNKPPFDDLKVRQAMAYALPYDKIMDSVMYGRAVPLFGANKPVDKPPWPQAHPYATDLAKAKALMAKRPCRTASRRPCPSTWGGPRQRTDGRPDPGAWPRSASS
jgi:ABC-type transport system substrate-binding protein